MGNRKAFLENLSESHVEFENVNEKVMFQVMTVNFYL